MPAIPQDWRTNFVALMVDYALWIQVKENLPINALCGKHGLLDQIARKIALDFNVEKESIAVK